MHYALIIYTSEDVMANMSEAERNALVEGYAAFHTEVVEKGIRTGGEPLQTVQTATTVKVREGKTLITDGPFAETKEQLAGIYFLECKDLDHAIELALKMPDAEYGSVEIRPILKHPY